MKIHPPALKTAGTAYLALVAFASLQVMDASAAEHGEEQVPYRAKRLFFGCWTRMGSPKLKQYRPSSIIRCFQEGRAIGGAYTESNGIGGDFCERWRVTGQFVLISDEYREQKCHYSLSNDKQTLTFTSCPAAGKWQFDKDFHRRSWPCRTQ
jgi:hypothetical protein